MALNFTHPHALGLAEARRRLVEESVRQGIEVLFDSADPNSGEVAAASPLGKVRARFQIREADIAVELIKKPAFVPESLVQGALEDGLTKLLG